MTLLILLCLLAFFLLLSLLRKNRVSLGLPLAYLFGLLLIHVPGAFAHVMGGDFLPNADLIELSMRFTTVGAFCFVAGVWAARSSLTRVPLLAAADRHRFCLLCLLAGWFLTFVLSPLYKIPSFSAAVDKGAAVWMLGVLLGLRTAVRRGNQTWIGIWLGSLMVYPAVMLLLGGFLSYGSAAIFLVCAALTISVRQTGKVVAAIAVFTFLSLSVFVNYFQHRDAIREQVWGGAALDARIGSVVDTGRDFELLNPDNRAHLSALDQRLNQNYFIGLAARRLDQGDAKYLYGLSVWEGLLSLIPRFLWPEKSVFAGSPEIVARMTGLQLSRTTSFGVGNVMEFQINFGMPGVIGGFLLLGWIIGKLDLKAAIAERRGELGRVIIFFLPCVALIQPNGSLVELFSGSAAAAIAAFGWNLAWKQASARGVFISRRRVRGSRVVESSPYSSQPAS